MGRSDVGGWEGAGTYHQPVLVGEVLELLAPRGDGWVVDGTLGGGGHARAVLERCPGCRLLGVDRDREALEEARRVLAPYSDRVRYLRARFDEAPEWLRREGGGVESVLLDLGMSSRHLDRDERGFAHRKGVPLDMRMDREDPGAATAAELLNEEDEDTLARIFRSYGEEPRGRRLAREVVARRRTRPFRTSDDLVMAIGVGVGGKVDVKRRARIFQALRIAVNRELEALEEALPAFRDVLDPGGRIVVISYHSLEDRRVKQAFREWSRSCVCPPGPPVCRCRGRALGEVLTQKPIRPSEAETEANPRARSARLRGWRKAA